ncbi:MAG: hypothetical protein HYV97_09755 [Bdellovibrio sp.]|nr:hypothetical protein [Bdellovibrio sp.]
MDKEIFQDFVNESEQTLAQAKILLGKYVASPVDVKVLSDVGILVDRVYGTAATLKVESMSALCHKMKAISYMAAQVDNRILNSIVAGTMLSVLDYLLDLVKTNALLTYDKNIHSQMVQRLDILSSKFSSDLRKTVAS